MNEPTMKPEFGAGRLTTSEYIVALEDEIDRLHEVYEFAAAQTTENAIAAVLAMVKLERAREIGRVIQVEAEKLRDIVQLSEAKRSHPAGRSRDIIEATGQILHVVKEAD